jgi:hypothetical protein
LSKQLERVTEKGLHVQYADEFLSGITSKDLNAIKIVYQKYGRSGIFSFVKEAYSSLTDDEADSVASEIVRRVTGRATSSWAGEFGDFNDMLAQIAKPAGGTEMMTNVASPGMHPAKTQAKPGNSGNYPDKAETLTGKYPQAYQNPRSPGRGTIDPNQENPKAKIGEGQTARDQYGPVGTPGSYGQFPDEASQGVLLPGTQGRVARLRYKADQTQFKTNPPQIKKGGVKLTSSFNTDYTGPHLIGWTQPTSGNREIPKFAIMPQAFGYNPLPSDGRGINRTNIQRSEKITKGLIKTLKDDEEFSGAGKFEEDNRVQIAGSREGAILSAPQRQRSFHTEETLKEDYGDTGDNSQYAVQDQSPYSDDQQALSDIQIAESLMGTGTGFDEEEIAPMTKLEEEDESRRAADEEEATRLDDMARYDEREATKAYNEGRYEAVSYLRAKALAERETATNFRKRSRIVRKALSW